LHRKKQAKKCKRAGAVGLTKKKKKLKSSGNVWVAEVSVVKDPARRTKKHQKGKREKKRIKKAWGGGFGGACNCAKDQGSEQMKTNRKKKKGYGRNFLGVGVPGKKK